MAFAHVLGWLCCSPSQDVSKRNEAVNEVNNQENKTEDTASVQSPTEDEAQEDSASTASNPSAQGQQQDSLPETAQILDLTDQEKQNYYRKYIEPLDITGMMYDMWNNAADIDVNRLLKFYEYNGYYPLAAQIIEADPEKYENASSVEMPAEDVESFMMYYFNVEQEYLRTADNYNSDRHTYSYPIQYGIGGGPGLEIEQVQGDGRKLIFYCKDMEGTQQVLTVGVEDSDHFKYVSNVCS